MAIWAKESQESPTTVVPGPLTAGANGASPRLLLKLGEVGSANEDNSYYDSTDEKNDNLKTVGWSQICIQREFK